MYCKNCGKEINDKAVVCVHCGVATGVPVNGGQMNYADEPASSGLIVLSVLFPLIGIIMGLVYNSNGKKKAGNTYIKAALISFGICMFIYVFSMIIISSI